MRRFARPIWFSDLHAATRLRLRDLIGMAFATAIVLMLIGLTLHVLFQPMKALVGYPFAAWIRGTGPILTFSPFLSWSGLLPGALVFGYLARIGYAGWAVALTTGATLGALLGICFHQLIFGNWHDGLALGIFLGLLSSGSFWLLLRVRTPAAIRTPI